LALLIVFRVVRLVFGAILGVPLIGMALMRPARTQQIG
jgi:hypothetical protein